jgi:hypothetical protein
MKNLMYTLYLDSLLKCIHFSYQFNTVLSSSTVNLAGQEAGEGGEYPTIPLNVLLYIDQNVLPMGGGMLHHESLQWGGGAGLHHGPLWGVGVHPNIPRQHSSRTAGGPLHYRYSAYRQTNTIVPAHSQPRLKKKSLERGRDHRGRAGGGRGVGGGWACELANF